jgi:hypothetical protein
LHANARCAEVTAADLAAGQLAPALDACAQTAVPRIQDFNGDDVAARQLSDLLA